MKTISTIILFIISYALYAQNINNEPDKSRMLNETIIIAPHRANEIDPDGTRLSFEERNKLDISHKKEFDFQQIFYCSISGTWEERFQKAVSIVKREFCIT